MENLAPIFIASSVRRSGTTLIQRLLCSAENCLIYGESCAHDLNFFLQMLISKQINFGSSSDFRDQMMAEVLEGKVDDWIADIMPPITDYIDNYKKGSGLFMEYLKSYAEKNGKELWGMKMAEWPAPQLLNAQKNMLKAKLIYIHRPLAACVTSAKKVGILYEPGDVEQFSQIWKQNYDGIQQGYPKDQLLNIDYEELVNQPAAIITQLEEFTGAKNIKPAVMKIKINTFKFDDRQEDGSKEGYLKPGKLTKEELEIIGKYDVQTA